MAKRVVVKIGSSSLTESEGGLNPQKLADHVSALAHLHRSELEVILVSSGAIVTGFKSLGLKKKPKKLEEKQAAAAVGQALLMQAYNQSFASFGITVGQVLLTRGDFLKRDSYNNALNTLSTLLRHRVIPIINENDTVATSEIKFGDNDILAALVASLIKADMLIILTDTDGLYESDPRKKKDARRIDQVEKITDEMREGARKSMSAVGTGGMFSKLAAAEQAMTNGISVFIGHGGRDNALLQIMEGRGSGTYFGKSLKRALRSRKQWVAFHADVSGRIIIDSGAVTAMTENGRSLLPVGVTAVEGSFKSGEVVSVHSAAGELIGKGITNYSATKLRSCMGKPLKSLVVKGKGEVIHRDDWVMLHSVSGSSPDS